MRWYECARNDVKTLEEKYEWKLKGEKNVMKMKEKERNNKNKEYEITNKMWIKMENVY